MVATRSAFKRVALALGALLALGVGVFYGNRLETSTQTVPAVSMTPAAPADPVLPVAQPEVAPVGDVVTAPMPAVSAGQADPLLALIEKVSPSSVRPASSPAPAATATGPVADADILLLRPRALTLPVQGISAAQITDTYNQARAAGTPHEAIDITAARGTPVLAAEDGKVAKLFLSKPGGITIYQFDPGSEYAYYYAHLDRYVDGLVEGASVKKGQVIGYVGSTGNASPDAPHLHFAIFKLGPERQWWRGTAVNPYLIWRDAK